MAKPTRKEWACAHHVRWQLAGKFPDCFAVKGSAKKRALKIGIDKDILAATDLNPRDLSLALYDYTNGPTYLKFMVDGAERVGLDGQPCGVVTAEQALEAAERLARRNVRDAARREKRIAMSLKGAATASPPPHHARAAIVTTHTGDAT